MRGCVPSRKRYCRFEGIFDAGHKRTQVLELEKKAALPEFWNNQEEAQSTLQKRSRLERDIQLDEKLTRDIDDLKALAELADEGEDVLAELTREVADAGTGSPTHGNPNAAFGRT